eukprot:scaffold130053_cov54-Phaeocystis_antarctica.AAC.6
MTSRGVISTASHAPARPPAARLRWNEGRSAAPRGGWRTDRKKSLNANLSPRRGITIARPVPKPRHNPAAPSAAWMLRSACKVPE